MTMATFAGRIIEAKGQVTGGRAILRLREVSGIKHELAELARRHQKHLEDTAAMRALIEAAAAPVWARDEAGKLVFANQAYARAVEARTARRPPIAGSSCSIEARAPSSCARTKWSSPTRAGFQPWSRASAAAST